MREIFLTIAALSLFGILTPLAAQKNKDKTRDAKIKSDTADKTVVVREGVGMKGIAVGKSSFKDVEKKFGSGYKTIKHKKYSMQMQYPNGLSFYTCQADPQRRVFDIEIRAPFEAKTSRGIVLSKSTLEDIRKIYGRKRGQSLTKDLEFRGVSFFYAPYKGKNVVSVIDIVENSGIRQCREAK